MSSSSEWDGGPVVLVLRQRLNFDYHVSFMPADMTAGTVAYNYTEIGEAPAEELPGASVFCKGADGTIFHT